jgi:hypothetical protein
MMMMATSVCADVYKCVSETGGIVFSDYPCGNDSELFLVDSSISVDEAIGNGSPFSKPMNDDYDIVNGIMAHAKKIGQSLFQEKQLSDETITRTHTVVSNAWKVFLSYKSQENGSYWASVTLDYTGEKTGEGFDITLKYLSVRRSDWTTPLKTIKKSKKLKMDAHYGWHVIP